MSARRLFRGLLLAAGLAVVPAPATAQASHVVGGVGGAVLGAFTGIYTTTAIYVTKARLGSYIYSLSDLHRLRIETLPIVLAPVGGLALGAADPDRIARAALRGGIGLVVGGGLGYLAGSILGDSDEARWSGLVIGSGAGLLAGTLIGALDGGGARDGPLVQLRVPIGPGGGSR